MKIRMLKAVMVTVGLVSFSVEAAVTNYWTSASGGSWSVASNWTAKNANGTDAAVVHNAERVYDFSALASGETVTCDVTGIVPMAMVFAKKAEGDHWTVTASSGCNLSVTSKSISVLIPHGTKLTYAMRITNAYGGTVNLTFTGGGTVDFATASWAPYCMRTILDNTTFEYNGVSDPPMAFRLQGDDACLKLMKDMSALGFDSLGSGTPVIDLNGHTLTTRSGYSGYCNFVWNGRFQGSGTFVSNGGVTELFGTSPVAAGTYTLQNGDLNLKAGAPLPAEATVNTALAGRLCSSNDQTVADLYGDGVSGGVVIPAGTTFTAGTSDTSSTRVLGGRLMGGGAFVKDGAGYTLTLAGSNRHTGGTRVKAGTLALRSSMEAAPAPRQDVYPDAAIHFDFEDAANLVTNRTTSDIVFTSANSNPCYQTNGVVGRGLYVNKKGYTATSDKLPGLADDFTISVWLKPDASQATQQWGQVFLQGDWTSTRGLRWLAYSYDTKIFTRTISKCADGTTFDHSYYFPNSAGVPWPQQGWHHYVVVAGNGCTSRTLYMDGVQVAKDSMVYGISTNILMKATFGGSEYAGCIDEFILTKGAWTAEQVKAEYERSRVSLPEARDPALDLPQPVAHYAFDDPANPGKDSSGNGYDLVNPGTIFIPEMGKDKGNSATYTVKDVAIKDDVPETFGTCAYFSSANHNVLVYPADAPAPSRMPVGNAPFSVSVRYQMSRSMGPTLVGWGDEGATNRHWRVMNGSSPAFSKIETIADGNSHGSSGALSGVLPGAEMKQRITWTHVVWTWNPTEKKFRGYYDGLYKNEVVLASPLDIVPTNLVIGCGTRARSWNSESEKFFTGYIDDVRIYDCTLTADQVKTLVRSLESGMVGSTLPEGAAVTVDAGATLQAQGLGHVFGSLAGEGTLDVLPGARVTLSNGVTFAGTLKGRGALRATGSGTVTLAAANNVFAGYLEAKDGTLALAGAYPLAIVRIYSNGCVTGDGLAAPAELVDGLVLTTDMTGANLPAVATTGKVTIPPTGRLTFSVLPQHGGTLVLAQGGSLDLPSGLSGWTCDCPSDLYKVTFESRDNDTKFVARIAYKGLMLIFR